MVKHVLRGGTALLAFALVVLGCNTADPLNPQEESGSEGEGSSFFSLLSSWGESDEAIHGELSVKSHRGLGDPTYRVEAAVKSDTNLASPYVDGGEATIADVNVSYHPQLGYYSASPGTFGESSEWGLAGNPEHDIPAFSDNMYLPEEIEFSSPVSTRDSIGRIDATVSKGEGITVTWNPDPTHDGEVAVGFLYRGDEDDGEGAFGRYELTEDDGHYVISSGELDDLPVGGEVILMIARVNGKVMGTSTHKFFVYGYTMAEGTFKLTE